MNELYEVLPTELVSMLRRLECWFLAEAGELLISRHVAPEYVLTIDSGLAEISVACDGNRVLLGVAGPGKILGLRPMISGELPETDITCVTDCRLSAIPRLEFCNSVRTKPEFYLAATRILSADLRLAHDYLKYHSRRNLRAGKKDNDSPKGQVTGVTARLR